MSKGLLPIARFPLPENWEPEGTICATFVIPDNPEYLAAITGLVDELKWSKSFARDETGTGAATVSRTWAKALESQPVFTQGCDMPEFRVGEDCLLEVNCGTNEEPNWQPVFTSEHPGGEPETPFPPDTPEYEEDTARCISAANIAAQLKYGTETLANDAAIVGGIAIAIIDLLGAFLFFVPGGVLIDIAIAIINLAVGHVASDFADDLPDIDWVAVRDALACILERDGSMTEGDKTEFLSYMNSVFVGNLAWELSKIIVQNVSADGLTNDARMPQNDISIEDCPSCAPWEHDSTDDTDLADWFAAAQPYDGQILGVYSGGVWNSEYANAGNDLVNIKSPDFVPVDVRLTGILIEAKVAIGDPYHLLQYSKSEDWSVSGEYWSNLVADVWETRESAFDEIDVRSLNVFLRQQQHDPTAKIRRIKLIGHYVT